MTEMTANARGEFIQEAIWTHARQIRSFIHSNLDRIAELEDRSRPDEIRRFLSVASDLVDHLVRLLDLSRGAKALRRLNREQLEAEVERLRSLLLPLRAEAAVSN